MKMCDRMNIKAMLRAFAFNNQFGAFTKGI